MIASPLLIRADAGTAIGTGHVMRGIALAQAWQDLRGHCIFAMAETTAALSRRIQEEGFEVAPYHVEPGGESDSQRLAELARASGADWIVVDGYRFDAEYQETLKSAGLKILLVDDFGHCAHYRADLLLNQNASADEMLYRSREPQTRLLLGPRYALLRREFKQWRQDVREVPSRARKVLVTLGGSDPENFTARAMDAVAEVDGEGLEAIVVLGGSNPHAESVERIASMLTPRNGAKITVRRNVSEMPKLMAWADVAISAAGTTCWEMCMLGLPALLIDVAENQRAVAKELHGRECAIHLGSAKNVSARQLTHELQRILESKELREKLSTRSRELVDGRGGDRVVAALRGDDGIHLRRANPDDCRSLFEWANDPKVRAASFSMAPISWEAHTAWFSAKLQSDCFIWIAEDDAGNPFGQIRFDTRADCEFETDISVCGERRGFGLACALIRLGVAALRKERRNSRIHAFVKTANVPSLRAFEKADFKQTTVEYVGPIEAVHLVYE